MIPFPLTVYFFSWWVLLALALGSLANVCILRIPAGESIFFPRSRCPHCRTMISWYQNIPVFSYIFLRGRCASCRAPISLRYPFIEGTCAALFAVLFWRHGGSPALLLVGGILTFHLLVISIIDGEHQIIPNGLSLSLLVLGLLLSPLNPLLGDSGRARIIHAVIGALAGFLSMLLLSIGGKLVWKKEALGGGDVKLMAGLGAFLGWEGAFYSIFLSSLIGTAWVILLACLKKVKRGSYLSFGPFLAVGAWLCWLWFGFWHQLFWLP